MVYNYKYPQFAYPYEALVTESASRARADPEFEIFDCDPDAWERGDFWDITVTYAKGAAEGDLYCRVVGTNCSSRTEELHVLPQLFFRNTWSWGYDPTRPWVGAAAPAEGEPLPTEVQAEGFERHLGPMRFAVSVPSLPGCNGMTQGGLQSKIAISCIPVPFLVLCSRTARRAPGDGQRLEQAAAMGCRKRYWHALCERRLPHPRLRG